jgi:antibiotic biosynthesis monooxygenase (ABM) superfamily enzyme
MAMCVAKATAAIVQRVPAGAVESFLEWQRGVTDVIQHFDGYTGTDVYPPAGDQGGDWVTLVHFDSEESLERWLDSPVRAEWIARLRASVGEFEIQMIKGGFSQWFTGMVSDTGRAPPGWKMALTVLFGLYPTVMLLSIFVVPFTSPLGLAFSMLIGNALSVSILQWVIMPRLTRLLAPWLEADPVRGKLLSAAGLVLLVVLLIAMAAMFKLATG